MTLNNEEIIRKNPIKRNTKFFSGEDLRLEEDFMTEYIEQDANQTIVLFQIDYEKTKVNSTYYNAKREDIRFKEPIELPVIYEIGDSELKPYSKDINKAVFSQIGQLTFTVLLKTLEEYDCDIRRGDYIGVQIDPEHIEYFTVADDGRVGSMSNKFTKYGTVPFARTITCAPISDKSEFNG